MLDLLTPFRVTRSVGQGQELYNMFEAHPELRDRQPEAWLRFGRKPLTAVRHVARMALFHETFHPFIARSQIDRSAIGIATIIGPQFIKLEETGERIGGYDLDYWLAEHRELEETTLAELLVKKAEEIAKYDTTVATETRVFGFDNETHVTLPAAGLKVNFYAAVDPEGAENAGLAVIMPAYGKPSRIVVDSATDPYGLASSTPAQLHLRQVQFSA